MTTKTHINIRQILVAALLAVTLSAYALGDSEEPADNADNDVRLNPQIGEAAPAAASDGHRDYAKYPFLNLGANHIIMNGADWSGLAYRIATLPSTDTVVSIVHIGDSHVQADGNTGRVRSHLQTAHGNAGRGLMAPLRMAGTNQPVDYSITSRGANTTATLLKMPWPVTMGFTGVAVRPQSSAAAEFTVKAPTVFNKMNIYAEGPVNVTDASSAGLKINISVKPEPWGAEVTLPHKVSALTFKLSGQPGKLTVYGFDVRNEGQPGILYHSIGNNGAAYQTYTQIGGVGAGISHLHPDLVIISLGANEAYGRISDDTFYKNINDLVSEIRRSNPDAKILLTTPAESQRSVYTRTRRKGRKGRRRRVATTRTFQINQNVERLRNVILRYGRENNIPVYDFYAVAGGKGSSAKWLQNRLLSADRIHRTWNGYYLEGDLLYDALNKALTDALPGVGQHHNALPAPLKTASRTQAETIVTPPTSPASQVADSKKSNRAAGVKVSKKKKKKVKSKKNKRKNKKGKAKTRRSKTKRR